MPNRLTRIPARAVPPLPPVAGVLLPLADITMLAMLSRPASGSLRHTWVTPATAWLSAGVALVALPLGVLLLGGGAAISMLIGAVVLIAVGLGTLSIVIVAALQRVAR